MMTLTSENKSLLDVLQGARTVVSQLDLDKTLGAILKSAMEITGTCAGSIALYNEKSSSLRIRAARGFSKNFIARREWKVRRGGLTDRILKSRSIIVLDDITNPSFFTNALPVQNDIKSLVCVPLICSHEVAGILYVDDFTLREFLPDDLHALEILASFASIAIANARTHASVKQQAITDSLTGLFNRRCFETILSREFRRAERHGREFSLALVDVNDFKKFNDSYGHQAGDRALASLGEAVRNAVRSTDVAARYGGDEIVIILPETKLQKAYNLFANRIKHEIEDGFRLISDQDHELSVTIGIASYPRDGKNAEELILSADRAMLAAKKMKFGCNIGCARPVAA